MTPAYPHKANASHILHASLYTLTISLKYSFCSFISRIARHKVTKQACTVQSRLFANFEDINDHELLYQPVVGRPPICHAPSGIAGKEKQHSYILVIGILEGFYWCQYYICFQLFSQERFPKWLINEVSTRSVKYKAHGPDVAHGNSLSGPCDRWALPVLPSVAELQSDTSADVALLKGKH